MTLNPIAQLDRLLTGLEQVILEADADDIVVNEADARPVRHLLERQLATRSRRKTDVKPGFRSELAGKLSALRELGVRRPELRTRLALAFRESERPSAEELDALIEQLTPSDDLKDSNK